MAAKKTAIKIAPKKVRKSSTTKKRKSTSVKKKGHSKVLFRNKVLLTIALFVITVIAIGTSLYVVRNSSSPKIWAITDSNDVKSGQLVRVKVYADSKNTSVNVAQFELAYPTDLLLFKQILPQSDYLVDAINKTEDNTIEITRGSIDNLTGEKLVAEIEFEAINSGVAQLEFSQPDTLLIDPVTVSNILEQNSYKNLTMEIK